MAFVASLLAYMVGVIGIVVAFAMGYAVMIASPSSEQTAASVTIAAPQRPNAVVANPNVAAAKPPILRERSAAHDQTARVPERDARDSALAQRRKLAANDRERAKRLAMPEPHAHAPQWAYQPPPDSSLLGLFDRQPIAER